MLAAKERMELLTQLADSNAYVTFDGGLDIRYLNDPTIEMFRNIKVKDYHFAWDDPRENLEAKFEEVASSGMLRTSRCGVYCLTNFWSTIEQDLHRIYTLRKYNFVPYVMVYDKQKFVKDNGTWRKGVSLLYSTEQLRHFKTCQHLQRWCNNRPIINSCPNFNDYEPYAKWLEKGQPVPTGGD